MKLHLGGAKGAPITGKDAQTLGELKTYLEMEFSLYCYSKVTNQRVLWKYLLNNDEKVPLGQVGERLKGLEFMCCVWDPFQLLSPRGPLSITRSELGGVVTPKKNKCSNVNQ